MAIFKCKMCGGTIEFNAGDSIGTCDSCGTKQTLPRTNDDAIANLFNRANNLRLKCEFDKAAAIYEKIVEQDDSDAEAHWGIVLCKYGIEYVDDPATGTKIPTCHRTLFEAVTADADYQAAMDYSDALQQSIYETEARTIDRIQKDILAIVKNEKPFDVFICYKETDENGKRTQDSAIANDIYYQLTQEGFKVFYAAITLEDKLGQEYEPYIFAALNSAKVMLVVGTNPMHFNAVWVRNEWSRFLKLMKTDRKKLLIPCYKDMDAYELPEEFAHLQAQDMGKIGFINDVVRGIKKVANKAPEKPADPQPARGESGHTAPLLKRAFMFLEDKDWSGADEYCEKVLDIDPENAQAYLGKLMAELHISRQEQLADAEKPFSDNSNYQKAVRFGDEKLVSALRGYNENFKLERKIKIDNIARVILNHGKSVSFENTRETIKREIDFLEKEINEFPIKAEKATVAQERIKVLSEQKAALNSDKSNHGVFKTHEKRKISDKIVIIEREIDELQKEVSKFRDDLKRYKSVENIGAMLEEKHAELNALLNGNISVSNIPITYEEAKQKLSADTALKEDVFNAYPEIRIALVNVGEIILFGTYPQNADGKDKTPIEWRVLEVANKKVLLISERALDCKQYNIINANIVWEKCSLRQWMNHDFFNCAFSAEEQAKIQNVYVSAHRNPIYRTNPGKDTTDRVFLLSVLETNKYLRHMDKKCVPTKYAITQGAYTGSSYTKDGAATCWWWLRSPGDYQDYVATVDDNNSVNLGGHRVQNTSGCVRPAMWISVE